MFLNRGEFVEINSDLLATYLFNDLSKSFTNGLQITKLCKNYKKFLNARAGQTAGRMQIFFCCSSPILRGKIEDLRTRRPFLFSFINALWGQFGPTLSKKGRLCKKWLKTSGLNYVEKFISVSFDQSKTTDLQILRKT